ncbi:PREDICTED: regulation of nuclear pre-mRNA domain-containing protein 2-like, partial [Leptosomus discolor]|uniref:regulation of nuclear pre-mRNA domain-containing protein 2-like n=1 Tax=Leptosomus discolor TaxID=188344 RepID=UPI0005226360
AFPHRLNLFYLANDVIQNCKRKNAIVFRDTFAEVLPEAASLVKDPSVSKSIERIFKIWEDRNVYPEETILALKEALSTTFKTQKQLKETLNKQPNKPWKKSQTSTNPKAALKSKIVAEFRPQSLIDELLLYKRSEDQIELKEKQLSTMRVDVCSTETLKCLKDKTGGKKFSKEFEEASSKLEEFVNGLDKQVKNGPSLTEALENAGIFYEAQYKEVKVVANAYKTFANRVSNLKKKLDQLKATLPDPEESPVPSPSMDAPSPTGSESPFQGMGEEDSSRSPVVGSRKTASPEPVTDNRDVEDMELSDVEDDTSKIIGTFCGGQRRNCRVEMASRRNGPFGAPFGVGRVHRALLGLRLGAVGFWSPDTSRESPEVAGIVPIPQTARRVTCLRGLRESDLAVRIPVEILYLEWFFGAGVT